MSKTTKITLEILTGKLPEFYLSLLRYITKGDAEALKTMADAIHFDYSSILKTMRLDEAKKAVLNEKLRSIHTYLFNSKRDSKDYLAVSRGSFEEFIATDFSRELTYIFWLMEMSRHWTGKGDSIEAKMAVTLLSFATSALIEGFNKAFNQPLSTSVIKETTPLSITPDNAIELGVEVSREITLKPDTKIDPAVFNLLDGFFTKFLKLPKNSGEQTQARDEVIISIYGMVKNHYPALSLHTSTTVTGYIGSCMGLIDTEKLHDLSDRKQPYRKYLRDTVYNILKSHSLIKSE